MIERTVKLASNRPVGVLTFVHTMNYGAELQALALRKSIEELGCSAQMIDYECPAVAEREHNQARLPNLSDVAHPRRGLKLAINYHANKDRSRGCKAFSSAYNVFGPRMYSEADISNAYDTVVVGSDQVWSPAITGFDKTFYLCGAGSDRICKIAYAASFGDSFTPKEDSSWYADAIRGFDAVSVRESSGARLVRELAGVDATVVLDPTLLLEAKVWRAWSEPLPEGAEAEKSGGFVFVYLVAEHERALSFACKIAAEHGLRVLAVDAYGLPQRGVTFVNGASPAQFLWLLDHAACVVTSSFHGVCFSVNFEKEFYFSIRDDADRSRSRLLDLGARLGFAKNEVGNVGGEKAPDRAAVSAQLNGERARSREFLRSALVRTRSERA